MLIKHITLNRIFTATPLDDSFLAEAPWPVGVETKYCEACKRLSVLGGTRTLCYEPEFKASEVEIMK